MGVRVTVAGRCLAAFFAAAAFWPCNSDAGTLTTLYSFEGHISMTVSDGAVPITGLLFDGSTTLYGATSDGATGNGRAFSVSGLGATGAGTYNQSCNFSDSYGGFGTPMGDLVSAPNGMGVLLYGAMSHVADPDAVSDGGPADNGVIVSCDPTGTTAPTVLASFGTAALGTIGGQPSGNLVAVNGTTLTIYGTTRIGGANYTTSGSVTTPSTTYATTGGVLYGFSAPTGSQSMGVITALHAFGAASVTGPGTSGTPQLDGVEPVGGLTSNGQTPPTLYGSTAFGGLNGFGTLFMCTLSSVSASSCATYKILYNFNGSTDGMTPASPLLYVTAGGTKLIGTTSNSGTSGGGTLFELPFSSSTLTMVNNFPYAGSGSSTGANPSGDLVFRANVEYGTTHGTGAGVKWQFNNDNTDTAEVDTSYLPGSAIPKLPAGAQAATSCVGREGTLGNAEPPLADPSCFAAMQTLAFTSSGGPISTSTTLTLTPPAIGINPPSPYDGGQVLLAQWLEAVPIDAVPLINAKTGQPLEPLYGCFTGAGSSTGTIGADCH